MRNDALSHRTSNKTVDRQYPAAPTTTHKCSDYGLENRTECISGRPALFPILHAHVALSLARRHARARGESARPWRPSWRQQRAWKTESQTGHGRLVTRLCTTLVSSVFWRNVAIHYADAAGVARRPAGILKDGSVLVGADYEEGVERRSGKECCVRRELHAGLADQSGGKRERCVVAAAAATAATAATVATCARARARVYRTVTQFRSPRVAPVTRPPDYRPSRGAFAEAFRAS